MIFVDRNPTSEDMTPTTFDSMAGYLRNSYPVADDVPGPIHERLDVAVDLVALAYEQVDTERPQLFLPLTDSAVTAALAAFERMLRHVLGVADQQRSNLGQLTKDAVNQGILSSEQEAIWRGWRDSRNELAHGDPAASRFGATAASMVGGIIEIVNYLATR